MAWTRKAARDREYAIIPKEDSQFAMNSFLYSFLVAYVAVSFVYLTGNPIELSAFWLTGGAVVGSLSFAAVATAIRKVEVLPERIATPD